MIAEYQLLLDGGVLEIARGRRITRASDADAWAAYQAYRTAGGEVLPADPPPTPPPLSTAEQLARLRGETGAIITAAYPLWFQANCANGIYPLPVAEKMAAEIAAVIAESNRCEDLIITGQPATPVWPTCGDVPPPPPPDPGNWMP